jgi:hypothetical protein
VPVLPKSKMPAGDAGAIEVRSQYYLVFLYALGNVLSSKKANRRQLEKRVLNLYVVEFLTVLQVFGVEDAAVAFYGGCDDQRVVPGDGVAAAESESTLV